jgi:hypothetical protein
MHCVSTHSLCGAAKASRSQLQDSRQDGGKLVSIEHDFAVRTDDLRRRRGLRDWAINRDNGGGVLVIRHCVLRIAHNDVRFAVDLMSGEMYSAEFVPLVDYIRHKKEKCPAVMMEKL